MKLTDESASSDTATLGAGSANVAYYIGMVVDRCLSPPDAGAVEARLAYAVIAGAAGGGDSGSDDVDWAGVTNALSSDLGGERRWAAFALECGMLPMSRCWLFGSRGSGALRAFALLC